jgi:hypothetical protein
MYLLIVLSQFEMANSIQKTANMIHDDIKASISASWLVTDTDRLNRKRPWNVCIPPRRLTTKPFSKSRA